uniref:Uncharacterized protein n=1 Tax=Ciona savignyi TaxID=51511 RepID=H2YGJ3_CIOSA
MASIKRLFKSFLAKTKRESDWPRSSKINCDDEPPKVLFSRVVNEVTDDFGIENLNQGEMNKTDKILLTRDKVKRSKSLSHNKDSRKISSIERSTDGKFRVSEVNSSEDLSIRKSSFLGKMRYPQKINQKITSRRPVSDCFIPRETQVLFDGTEVIEEEGMLEIDCS